MSNPEPGSSASFVAVWKEAFAKIFTQLGAASVQVNEAGETPDKPQDAEIVSAVFAGGGCLAGKLQWGASKAVAIQCAQLLMSEAIDPSAAFSDTYADGFLEFLRQIAGEAALAWKESKGAPAELLFQSDPNENIASVHSTTLIIQTDKAADLNFRLDLDSAMEQSLDHAEGTDPQDVTDASDVAECTSRASLPSNLDLLLDVQLDATIRFGEREMLLQDVFGLMPGAVVELDQLVNEPADLLVAGRLVAKGEVVVVEGNFGLRVTEVARPAERAAALSLSWGR